MLLIHDSASRGRTRTGWLDSQHSFSFGGFRDPARMGIGPLRVFNDDRVIPGAGFGAHDHESMDILTYVLTGALRHEDSLGTVSEIRAGDVQLMSAGSGITHSEMNASADKPVHFLQIWIIPDHAGGPPAYRQLALPGDLRGPDLVRIAGGPADDAVLPLRSGTRLWRARPDEGQVTAMELSRGRLGFVHIVDGLAEAGGERLRAGDALEVAGEPMPALTWLTAGEALYFDLPPTHS